MEVRRVSSPGVGLRREGMEVLVPVLRASFGPSSLGTRRASLRGVEVFSSRRRPLSLRAIIRREEGLCAPAVLEEGASLRVEASRHGVVRPRARRKRLGFGPLLRRNRLGRGQVSGRVLELLSGVARDGERVAGLFYPVPRGASFRLFEGGLMLEGGGRWEESCALALLVRGVGGRGLSLRFVSFRVEG